MKLSNILFIICLVFSSLKAEEVNKSEDPKGIPEKMQAAYLTEKGENKLEIGEIDIPVPEYDQVLIKVDAAPLNPSDLYMIEGKYGEFLELNYPFVPGFEGSGTVVGSGGGILPWYLQGKRVAFTKQDEFMHSGRKLIYGGSIAQYAVTDSQQCIVLDDKTSFNQGAVSFLNYLTSVGLVEQVTKDKGKSVLITAAASTVGQLMMKQFNDLGIDVIAVVRTDEQESIVRERFKVKEVLNQDEDTFELDLTRWTREYECRHALDSVGGAVLGKLVNWMPSETKIISYGNLSKDRIKDIDAFKLMYNDITIQGFMVNKWIREKFWFQKLWIIRKIRKLFRTYRQPNVAKEFELKDLQKAIEFYESNMTRGKVVIKPWSKKAPTVDLK